VTRPDIELGFRMKAKRLRFEEEPDVDTHVEGHVESEQERENLPDEVKPGVTYRNVEIRAGARLFSTDGPGSSGDRRSSGT
jgi:hypothetical protein